MMTHEEYLKTRPLAEQEEAAAQHEAVAISYCLTQVQEELENAKKQISETGAWDVPEGEKLDPSTIDIKLTDLSRYVKSLGGDLSLLLSLPTGKGVVIHVS